MNFPEHQPSYQQNDLNEDAGLDDFWAKHDDSAALQATWRRDPKSSDAGLVAEFNENHPTWAKARRIEYLTYKLRQCESAATYWLQMVQEWATSPDSLAMARMWLSDASAGVAKGQREIGFLKRSKQPTNGRLDDAQIERARRSSFASLFDGVKEGDMIPCPIHRDRTGKDDGKPSMLVNADYGYCFSCNGSLDPISYLMKVRGLDFRSAVLALL